MLNAISTELCENSAHVECLSMLHYVQYMNALRTQCFLVSRLSYLGRGVDFIELVFNFSASCFNHISSMKNTSITSGEVFVCMFSCATGTYVSYFNGAPCRKCFEVQRPHIDMFKACNRCRTYKIIPPLKYFIRSLIKHRCHCNCRQIHIVVPTVECTGGC